MWIRDLVLLIIYVLFYPFLILSACLYLQLDVFTWLLFLIFLAPEIVLADRYYRKLAMRKLAAMMTEANFNVDMDKTLEEYQKLLHKDRGFEA